MEGQDIRKPQSQGLVERTNGFLKKIRQVDGG